MSAPRMRQASRSRCSAPGRPRWSPAGSRSTC